MCNFKHKWLKDCPGGFKPFLCRQYFDYILVLFSSVHYAEKFKYYLPFKHPNISFSLVKEKDGDLSLLEINIFPEKAKIITFAYRKKTFSGVYTIISVDYTAISISIPETNKTGLMKSFLFQCFSLCSNFVKFHYEINILKSFLYKDSYPRDFVNKGIKEFFDRVLTPRIVSSLAKRDLLIVLPYLVKLLLQICLRINRVS